MIMQCSEFIAQFQADMDPSYADEILMAQHLGECSHCRLYLEQNDHLAIALYEDALDAAIEGEDIPALDNRRRAGVEAIARRDRQETAPAAPSFLKWIDLGRTWTVEATTGLLRSALEFAVGAFGPPQSATLVPVLGDQEVIHELVLPDVFKTADAQRPIALRIVARTGVGSRLAVQLDPPITTSSDWPPMEIGVVVRDAAGRPLTRRPLTIRPGRAESGWLPAALPPDPRTLGGSVEILVSEIDRDEEE